MKEKWLNNLIKEAHKTKLTRAEKQTMLSAILGNSIRIPSPYQFAFTSFVQTYHRQAIAFVVIFALAITTGSASFAAERALPGEALYIIKVNVNEELKSLTALSPDAKARVGIERTTKRLKEAEKLADEGRLTPEAQVIIKDNIKSHGEDIKASLAVLASTDSTTTAQAIVSDFRASVEAISPSNSIAQADTDLGLASTTVTTSESDSFSATLVFDVEADAQAIGLLSITEELKADLVDIEEKLAGTSTPAIVPEEAPASTTVTPNQEPFEISTSTSLNATSSVLGVQ